MSFLFSTDNAVNTARLAIGKVIDLKDLSVAEKPAPEPAAKENPVEPFRSMTSFCISSTALSNSIKD